MPEGASHIFPLLLQELLRFVSHLFYFNND